MSIFVKPKLKALKECLGQKDWPGVEKNARAVLDFESSNYNARVFLALALFNLEQPDEAEETYKKAIEQSPGQALARQGLASFYEKKQRWTDYARELQGLMQLFADSQDATKYAEALEKLLDVRRKFGTKDELIETLHYLLPSSPSHALLRALPEYDPTAPTATSYPTVQRFSASPLPVLLELISLISAIETAATDAEIKKRRQRLGGPALTAEETMRQVQAEYLPRSQLPGLWRQVLEDPDAGNDEPLRRDIERRLLAHLRTTLRALPSPFDAPTVDLNAKAKGKNAEDVQSKQAAKDYYRGEVQGLARGMVVIAVPEPAAWEVAIEWSDLFADDEKVEHWPKERWDLLRRQAELFPESGLAKLAIATSQRVAAAATAAAATAAATPPADEEEPVELPSAPSDDEMTDIVENALAQSPRSLVTHLLAAAFFARQKEWDALLQVSEAGLAVAKALEAEIGQGLPRSRRMLDTHLALSLVYNAPPTHHLRALRLLEHMLAAPPPPPSSPALSPRPHPDPTLLMAKAHVLQSSDGKQAAALKVWDQVLALSAGALPHDALRQAKGERAWALHLAGQSDEARVQLEEVVGALEERKKGRDKEREEKEKYRSKKGLEKPDGVEEGEQPEEAEERAKAWWRLGECLWKLSELDPEQTQQAYDAYIAALRASPAFAPAFTSLGIYYRSLSTPDWERSSKCFQKAFELDPAQEVAARFLAEEFADLGEWSLVEVISRRVVEGNKGRLGMGGKAAARLAWAWKAIGASELNSKKFPQAVAAFQAALRGAPEDVSTWIKLGVAYRHSGKHIAALKVFVKALALDPSSWFAKYSVADVQREVGLLEPALKTFREILVDRPDELGVKVVLAETALVKGLEEQRAGFMVRAEESLVEALRESTAIVEGGTATRVAWKVAADALIGLSKVPQPELREESSALMRRILEHLAEQDVDSKIAGMSAVTVGAVQQVIGEAPSASVAVALSVLAAKMRVLLETQNEAASGSAWYDLGVAISNFRNRLSTLPSWPAPSDQALQQAIRCLKFALHKEPLNSTFWNALGVLSFDLSPRLAQHCFIRAIEHNARTAIPWTNLGLFYLVHGDEDLSNQAFLKAQVLDSDWAAAWVGQATLADLAGHAVEASVLLEHAVSLGAQAPEADIAYASRAFEKYRASVPSSSTAEAIPGATPPSAVETLSAPLFALTRYLAQKPEDHTALHLNALILEQVGDLASACESLEKAAALLEELYEVDESPAVEGQYVIAQTNLGRVRLASEKHQGALEAFEAALSLLSVDASEVPGGLTREQSVILLTECKLGSSLAHVWLDDPDSAKQVLEGGLEDLEAHQVGACATHLGDALARVYWAEQDEDRALAALLDSPSIPQGKETPLFHRRLFYAHAIASNDNALLQTTRQYTWNPAVKYDPELSRLSTLHHLSKRDAVGALSTVSRMLHATPWAPAARSRVAHLICTLEPLDERAGADDPLTPLLANVETAGRLMRLRVPGAEDAMLRSRRARTRGVVELQRAAEAEDDEAAQEHDEQALRFFERSMWIAPWEKLARDKFAVAKAALAAE